MKNILLWCDVVLIVCATILIGFGNKDMVHVGFILIGVRSLAWLAMHSGNAEEHKPKNTYKP